MMRQRKLKNGILVNFSFSYLCEWPHFEYFSHELSSTGYFSDIFIYEGPLTEEEILEAFDVRANLRYEKYQIYKNKCASEERREQCRKERQDKEAKESRTVQLTMEF